MHAVAAVIPRAVPEHGLNRTCYSWRRHPEIVNGEQVVRRHRCRDVREHGGAHDCGRLPCIGFPWRRWAS